MNDLRIGLVEAMAKAIAIENDDWAEDGRIVDWLADGEAALDAALGFIEANVDLALLLSKIVHDAQDEHGLRTRHDIGLVLVDALMADVEKETSA